MSVVALFAIPRRAVGMSCSSLSYPVPVSFAGCVTPPAPAPSDRLSRLRVLWAGLTPQRSSGSLPVRSLALPAGRNLGFGLPPFPGFPFGGSISACLITAPGTAEVSQVLGRFSSHMPDASTPTGPPVSRQGETFVSASTRCDRVAACFVAVDEALVVSGRCRAPLACTILCLRFTTLVRRWFQCPYLTHRSACGARLDRGGWLALAPLGLSPSQKRQASLDAPIPNLPSPRF